MTQATRDEQALVNAAYKHATEAAPIQLEKQLSPFTVARTGFLAGAEWRAAQATQTVGGDVKEDMLERARIIAFPHVDLLSPRHGDVLVENIARAMIDYGDARAKEAFDECIAMAGVYMGAGFGPNIEEQLIALKSAKGVGNV